MGFTLDHHCSTPTPRTKPESTRPPEIRSDIAICSASRTGFSSIGRMFPSRRILARRVVRARIAADMLTPTFTHDGVEWCSLTMRRSEEHTSELQSPMYLV